MTQRKPPKRYSILIVPEKDSHIRRFEFSKRVITASVAVFAMIIIGVLSSFLALGHYYRAYVNTEDARIRAAAFERSRVALMSKIAELEDSLQRTQRFAAKLKAITSDEKGSKIGYGPLEKHVDEGLWRPPYSNVTTDELANNVDLMKDRASELEQIIHTIFAEQQDEMFFWSSLPTLWPTHGFITSPFGRPRGHRLHEGIDLAGPTGTPIVAPGDGLVTHAGYKGGYGNTLIIDHGYGISTLYGHCSAIHVKEGDRVKRGTVVASVGNTGSSTGPHLHYEVHLDGAPINPMQYLAKR